MQRLGKNLNRYCGETIDIERVLQEIREAVRQHGWSEAVLFQEDGLDLLALRRAALGTKRAGRVYISAGIHGDEPAGPLAALRLLKENLWPESLDLWLCPCLNPAGFRLNCRENARGIDLNRGYLNPAVDEIIAHIDWLATQPRFDLCLLLHEDWESHGFYLYEQNPDGRASLAHAMIDAVAAVCPVDRSELIDGRPARDGIVRPGIDPRSRPDWPEAFYIITHKTRLSYTLETPSDFALSTRVESLVVAVNTAVQRAAGESGRGD